MEKILFIENIDMKNHPFLTSSVLEFLKTNGINTIHEFINHPIEKLVKITRLKFKEVSLIRKQIINEYAANSFTGLDYYEDIISNSALITSGIRNLDLLLEGGLLSGKITEINGEPCSGKSQICYTLATTLSQRNQSVYVIDTKNDFTNERLIEVLITQGYNLKDAAPKVKRHIIVENVFHPNNLVRTLDALETEIKKWDNLRLIIIDSFSHLFLPLTFRDGRFGLLNHVAQQIRALAKKYYLTILITNCYKEDLDLGPYWKDVVDTSLGIKQQGEKGERKLRILKSYSLKKGTETVIKLL